MKTTLADLDSFLDTVATRDVAALEALQRGLELLAQGVERQRWGRPREAEADIRNGWQLLVIVAAI